MTPRKALFWLAALLLLALGLYLFHTRVHFDWPTLFSQLRNASPAHLLAGIALIYLGHVLRATRWSVFLAPTKPVSPLALVGSQFVGFTAVALFGRLADLTRPILIARRVHLPVSSQIAVYTVERMFDLGAAATLFSAALIFTPRSMPHHDVFLKAGPFSLAVTAAAALFAFLIRRSGPVIAARTRILVSRLSPALADSLAAKILEFRDGLDTIRSPREFLAVLTLSLVMWIMIGLAYMQTTHAFPQTPELAHLSFSSTMLLMAASIGGSLLQLPILGWFTQIAVQATALHTFFGAPLEAATACGGALLFVTFLSVIPAGLLFARLEGISLAQAAHSSEALEQNPT